ncbi:MAG: magnesium transporter CorA family protein [Treponema sp.]|nr:magnesium transporter CorA family protein [Treponema sp.]
MITFWQQIQGKLVNLEKNELDPNLKTWVDARCVTREDIAILENEYKIDPDHILDILDPDELSRIEDGDDYILTITRLPIFVPAAEVSYFAIPLGIITTKDAIITICWTDCEVLKDFSNNRVKGINMNDFPSFLITILSRAAITYLRYLKEINRRAVSIQGELQYAVENKEILQLLNLEKSMLFFTTSLKSNQLLVEKFRRTKFFNLDEDDRDDLEDVAIDNRQALEMADTYSSILSTMLDAFGNVISNNVNSVMKKLTVATIVITVPTFITSFYGMNIPLPFQEMGKWSILIVTALCFLAVPITRFILRDKPIKSNDKKKAKPIGYKNKIAIKKIKKQLAQQEAALEEKEK